MHVFLDFEASSLGKASYPIEVAWVFEDGREESHLIRPAGGWTDWDETAEAIHGLSRQRLQEEGEAHERVAARMMEALAGHELFAGAPSWDGKWLSVLLRSGGFPRHALRLGSSHAARETAATAALSAVTDADARRRLAAAAVAAAETSAAAEPPAHRALADARRELWTWRRSRAEAEAMAAGQDSGGFRG